MKVDIGVHIRGHIIDSAFTAYFDPKFDNLSMASREATYTGVKVINYVTCYFYLFIIIFIICLLFIVFIILDGWY